MLHALLVVAALVAPLDDETWDALAAEHDERVGAWVDAMMAARRDGVDAPVHPTTELMPRFAALADGGEGRATLWVARHLHLVDDGMVDRLLEQVARGEPDGWAVDTLYVLAQEAPDVARDRILEHVDVMLAADGVADEHRARLLVTKGELLDGEAATAAYLDAVMALLGIDAVPTEDESPDALDDVARRVEEVTEAAYSQRWNASFGATDSGVYFQKANATPDPKDACRPLYETLAHRGATPARLRVLGNVYGPDATPPDVLRAHLRALDGSRMSERDLKRLGYDAPWFVEVIGIDVVADELRRLIDEGPESGRATAMNGLAIALCEHGDDDARARGLALFDDVVERWPESDAARRATGQRRRYTELLVGQVAPDVVTEDVDGQTFALSDYRGQVTVLKFYGFW